MTDQEITEHFYFKVVVRNNISLEEIKKQKAEKVFYSSRTAWWTTNPDHLGKDLPVPHDPTRAPLLEATNVDKWFDQAENDAKNYGEYGLEAFMASHHLNSLSLRNPEIPWASPNWEDYNDAIRWTKSAGAIIVPKDFLQGVEFIFRDSNIEKLKFYADMPEEEFTASTHHYLGKDLRNHWHLWNENQESGIRDYFNKVEITHADDMSGILLTSFHRVLMGKPVKLAEQIKTYKDFWKKNSH